MPPDPVRTRIGVGEAFIDHAAGMPLQARRPSLPPSADYANVHSANGFQWTEDPVDLPLRSRTKTYVIVAALIAAFIAVLVSVVWAGGSSAAAAAGARVEAPATPSPASVSQ
jgi:hypothetical protein